MPFYCQLREEVLKKIDRNCQPRMRRFFLFDDGLAYGNLNTPTGDTDVHFFFSFDAAVKVYFFKDRLLRKWLAAAYFGRNDK